MKRPKHVENLPWRSIGGRCVIIHPRRGEVHELDEVASFLWQEADGARSVTEICERLVERFDVEADQARRDAEEFFARLDELGLIGSEHGPEQG